MLSGRDGQVLDTVGIQPPKRYYYMLLFTPIPFRIPLPQRHEARWGLAVIGRCAAGAAEPLVTTPATLGGAVGVVSQQREWGA